MNAKTMSMEPFHIYRTVIKNKIWNLGGKNWDHSQITLLNHKYSEVGEYSTQIQFFQFSVQCPGMT